MAACPYHVRVFNWWDPVWPDGMEKMLNPSVSVRMRGVVEKCSFCIQRYQLAKEKAFVEGRREIEEAEYQTACTEACPAGAITFGDLNNHEHAVYQLALPDSTHHGQPKNPKAFRLLERLGTNPKVYYLSSRQWVRKAGDNYLKGEFENKKQHS
jgi:molybdopterin-containing oxidoreductase family iron-sulfur binding subunit